MKAFTTVVYQLDRLKISKRDNSSKQTHHCNRYAVDTTADHVFMNTHDM